MLYLCQYYDTATTPHPDPLSLGEGVLVTDNATKHPVFASQIHPVVPQGSVGTSPT